MDTHLTSCNDIEGYRCNIYFMDTIVDRHELHDTTWIMALSWRSSHLGMFRFVWTTLMQSVVNPGSVARWQQRDQAIRRGFRWFQYSSGRTNGRNEDFRISSTISWYILEHLWVPNDWKCQVGPTIKFEEPKGKNRLAWRHLSDVGMSMR